MFLLGLTAHSLIAVVARAFYALQDTATPVAAALLAVVVNIVVANALVGPYGLAGLAAAIAVAAWLETLMLVVLLPAARPGPRPGPRRGRDDEGAAGVGGRRGRVARVRGAARRAGARTRASCSCWSGPRVTTICGGVVILAASAALRIEELRLYRRARGRPRSADRAAHDGQPARGRPGATDAAGSPDIAAWDAFVEENPLGSYLQLDGWARVKAVNGWSARRLLDAPGGPAPRSSSGGRDPCRGRSPTRRAARCSAWDAATVARFTDLPGRPARRGPGQPPPRRPRDRARRDRDDDGAVTARWARVARRRRDPARLDPRDRPRGRRGRPVGRPAQEVAPVREQGPLGRGRVVDAGPERLDEFYPIYQETAARAGLPDPGEVRLPRRLGRLRLPGVAQADSPGSGSPPARPSPGRSGRTRRAARGGVARPAPARPRLVDVLAPLLAQVAPQGGLVGREV